MTFKPTLTALAAAACLLSGATQAAIVVVSGTTAGGPTFNRPLVQLSGLSAIGTAVPYNAYQFRVSVAGDYTFLTTGFTPQSFDTFTILYSPSFNAASPLTGALVASDDLLGTGLASGFAYSLITSTTYTYVTTGFGNTDAGQFTNVIGGPGVITQVPEPSTYVLLAMGLGALGLARRHVKTGV